MIEPNPSIDVRFESGAGIITLNRPRRYNAITIPMMQRLRAALDEMDADEATRCVILTATGEGFCAGQDLNVLAKFHEQHEPGALGMWLRDHYNSVIEAIWSSSKPVIAAVQGVAAGAGWSLALACDLRVAARSARFVPGFCQIGLIPDLGGTKTLVDAVGYAKAMEFALFRDRLTADEALDFGLINRVVDDEDLMSACLAMAGRIAALPPSGVRLTKRALQQALTNDPAKQLTTEAWLQSIAASDPAHAERVAAFARRSAP